MALSAKGLISAGSLWEDSSAVPVMPGASTAPEHAGVIGSPSASSELLDFLQRFHFLPEASMANGVSPLTPIRSSQCSAGPSHSLGGATVDSGMLKLCQSCLCQGKLRQNRESQDC